MFGPHTPNQRIAISIRQQRKRSFFGKAFECASGYDAIAGYARYDRYLQVIPLNFFSCLCAEDTAFSLHEQTRADLLVIREGDIDVSIVFFCMGHEERTILSHACRT